MPVLFVLNVGIKTLRFVGAQKESPTIIGLSKSMAAPISLSPNFCEICVFGEEVLLQLVRKSLEEN
jgi:hypothetical protein